MASTVAKYEQALLDKGYAARRQQYLDTVQSASAKHGIPWRLLDMVIANETGYKQVAGTIPTASGKAPDEFGMAQIRPATARSLGLRVDKEVDDRRDPAKELDAAAKYLSGFYKQSGGDWGLAGAGYNHGSIKPSWQKFQTARDYHAFLSEGQKKYGQEGQNRFPPAPAPAPVVAPVPAQASLMESFGVPIDPGTYIYAPIDAGKAPSPIPVPRPVPVQYRLTPSDFALETALGMTTRGKLSNRSSSGPGVSSLFGV
jgi:Transglycosylase SLT domain